MAGRDIDTLILVNNAISARMAEVAIESDGVDLSRTMVFLLRNINPPWVADAAAVSRYPEKPRETVWEQWRFTSFFARAARQLKAALATGHIRRIYIVNVDNVLSNHVVQWAADHPEVDIVLLVEGIFNFQDITVKNRARWRWMVKPVMSRMLRLRWRTPAGHLGGADEPAVRRVVSFTAHGLKSPPEKIDVMPWPVVTPVAPPRADTLLIAHTGLWKWMSPEDYMPIARGFADWVAAQGFQRILVKDHPFIPTGPLADMLPPHEHITGRGSLEDMAADIDAATLAGTCCTGLVTLKLMRPDLRCVDFGSNAYCETAYHGDHSVEALLIGAGVELVPLARTSPA